MNFKFKKEIAKLYSNRYKGSIVINSYSTLYVLQLINQLKLEKKIHIESVINMPNKLKTYVVIKSPHVHNKSREKFLSKTHKTVINILFNKIDHEYIEQIESLFENISGLEIKLNISNNNNKN